MKEKYDLQNLLIIIIGIGILILLLYLRFEISQVKDQMNFLSHSESNSLDLGILKDFMDRNVKVYGTITTAMVTIAIFALGVYTNIKINSSQEEMESNLLETRKVINSIKMLESSIQSDVGDLEKEFYYNTAIIFSSQSQGIFTSNNLKLYTIFQSIYGYVRSFPVLTDEQKEMVQTSLDFQINHFNETLEALIKESTQNAAEAPISLDNIVNEAQLKHILFHAPEDYYDRLFDLQNRYREALKL